jgi:hypothetical protein
VEGGPSRRLNCIGPAQQARPLTPEWTPGAVERPWSDSIAPIAASYLQTLITRTGGDIAAAVLAYNHSPAYVDVLARAHAFSADAELATGASAGEAANAGGGCAGEPDKRPRDGKGGAGLPVKGHVGGGDGALGGDGWGSRRRGARDSASVANHPLPRRLSGRPPGTREDAHRTAAVSPPRSPWCSVRWATASASPSIAWRGRQLGRGARGDATSDAQAWVSRGTRRCGPATPARWAVRARAPVSQATAPCGSVSAYATGRPPARRGRPPGAAVPPEPGPPEPSSAAAGARRRARRRRRRPAPWPLRSASRGKRVQDSGRNLLGHMLAVPARSWPARSARSAAGRSTCSWPATTRTRRRSSAGRPATAGFGRSTPARSLDGDGNCAVRAAVFPDVAELDRTAPPLEAAPRPTAMGCSAPTTRSRRRADEVSP